MPRISLRSQLRNLFEQLRTLLQQVTPRQRQLLLAGLGLVVLLGCSCCCCGSLAARLGGRSSTANVQHPIAAPPLVLATATATATPLPRPTATPRPLPTATPPSRYTIDQAQAAIASAAPITPVYQVYYDTSNGLLVVELSESSTAHPERALADERQIVESDTLAIYQAIFADAPQFPAGINGVMVSFVFDQNDNKLFASSGMQHEQGLGFDYTQDPASAWSQYLEPYMNPMLANA